MIRNISNKETHVYSLIISEKIEGISLTACLPYLTGEDIKTYSKLRIMEKKKELLISRIFIWHVLERYLGPLDSLRDVCIKKDFNGKPFLFIGNECHSLYFNLTHTQGLISCVVSLHHPIGIDAEYMCYRTAYFIEDHLTLVEKEELQNTQDKITRLYELWTLKEAYLKADGRGLTIPLDSFGFIFKTNSAEGGGEKIRIQFFDTEKEKEAEQWFFKLYRPTPQHSLAVAVRMDFVPLWYFFTFAPDDLHFFNPKCL